jgi:hypothetical protein
MLPRNQKLMPQLRVLVPSAPVARAPMVLMELMASMELTE